MATSLLKIPSEPPIYALRKAAGLRKALWIQWRVSSQAICSEMARKQLLGTFLASESGAIQAPNE
jgi:hypothetical protein